MRNHNIFITGATSGIGLGIAQVLASEGHQIAYNGIAELEETIAISEKLTDLGATSVHYFDADMRDGEAIRKMIANAENTMGPIDVLINNAGIQHLAPIENFPISKWDDVIAVNLTAHFHTIASVIEGMRSRGFGRIINISSVHGLVASANKSAYVTAKHGVVGLTKTVAIECATDGITANAICPGWVRTPLVESQIHVRSEISGRSFEEEASVLIQERQPSQAFVTPEQIGSLCLYLMSMAAASVTGMAIPIDGAWTAQ
jgi:3-hydroxybutyrate dehydrogenase